MGCLRQLCLLTVCIVTSLNQAEASTRRLQKLLPGSLHDEVAKERIQSTFNELVYEAERLYADLKNEEAAVGQVRTAFLLCPSCLYSGPKLSFFDEMFGIDRLVDRAYLLDNVFPAIKLQFLAPTHLWIGVKPYSTRYEYILRAAGATRFDTIEPDTAQVLYGSSRNHFVDIAQNIDKYAEKNTYNIVIANGVLGWGIDTPAQVSDFYSVIASVMRSGGLLIIGYNPHIGSGHTNTVAKYFESTTIGDLPQKMQFKTEWKHTFEFYRKI